MAVDNTNPEVDPMEEELRRRAEQSAQGYSGPPATGQPAPAPAPAPAATPYAYTPQERDRIVQGWAKSGNAYTNDRAGVQGYLSSLGDAGKGWKIERDDKVYDPKGRIFDWIGKVGTSAAQKRTGYTTDSRYASVTGSSKPKVAPKVAPKATTAKPVAAAPAVPTPVAPPTQPITVAGPAAPAPTAPTEPERDPRWDAFYGKLMDRAGQGLNVDRSDPAVRAQADAYAANEERAKRQYLAQAAEEGGPNANLRMEERMAAEGVGQRSGAFESELMGREISARRDEIAGALSQMQGMLTVEQENSLRAELAKMDDLTRRYQTDVNAQSQKYSTDRGFDSNKYSTDVGANTSRYGISTGAATARRGQDFDREDAQRRNEQFLRELGFRQSDSDRDYDLRYRGL
jgi:hypothetical protein